MALDLHRAARQIGQMAGQLQDAVGQRDARLLQALRTMERPLERETPGPLNIQTLRGRVAAAAGRRITWLVPEPHTFAEERPALGRAYHPPALPMDYTAVATDGSQIDVDRHGPAHCFLINIGGAAVHYGTNPSAELFAEPYLFSRPEELAFQEPGGGVRETPIDGPLLGLKRMVMECQEMVRRLENMDPAIPTLALLDGSLVLWELSGERYPEFVREQILDLGLLAALDSLKKLASTRWLAFGSYISLPRSTEVVNVLRVAHCPHDALETLGCDRICGKDGIGRKECNAVALGLMDRDLFDEVLEPGERSGIYSSQSPIVLRYYGEHQVSFFYVHLGNEIGRIELPRWLAENEDTVGFLHAALLDQCAKGPGYPLVLQEAHERAVVTWADRRAFWAVVQATLQTQGIEAGGSLKARSKRLRSV